MFGNFSEMLQQAQKMKEEIAQIQERAASRRVEGTAGGGMVKVVANGRNQILSITIEPDVLKMNDKAMLEDLVRSATNQALLAAQESLAQEMEGWTSKLGPLASLFKGK